MKALVLEQYKHFVFTDMPVPQISDDDVLVRVKVCGICGSDIHGMDGSSGRRIPPLIMGHENAGWIEEVGPEVEGFISVAPQPNIYDFSFLAPCPSSGLIIHGDADKVAPPKDVQGLVDKLHAQKGITITQKTLPGANHFFSNESDQLIEDCSDYLDRRLAGELSDRRPRRLR